MIQAIFFDVDDTLYSHTIADVYPSTKIAINKLKEKGIKLFLATGRHINELKDILNKTYLLILETLILMVMLY